MSTRVRGNVTNALYQMGYEPDGGLMPMSCLFRTHCVNNLFWGLGGGCVIMKEMQCSEAESTANHLAFSAPGLTRHRAACCVHDMFHDMFVVALAFLLSNPRWLSNICFQIGFRLQIFAFKSAASPQSLLMFLLGCDGGRPGSTRHQSRALYVPERLRYRGCVNNKFRAFSQTNC